MEDTFCQYLKLNFHIKTGYCLIRLTETPLKMMKNIFYFTWKAIFGDFLLLKFQIFVQNFYAI